MKKMMASLLLLASLSTMAKMTVFNADQALELVANDHQLIENILTKSKTNKVVNIDAEQVDFNQFEVLVTTKKAKVSCETLVDVKAVMSTVTLPGGGKISANNLKILKVSKAVCK